MWKMIDSKTFVAEKYGYQISIKMGAALGYPYWAILKDGVIIDECWRYPPTSGELDAKVKSERVLNALVQKSDT